LRSPRDSLDSQNKPRGAACSQIICKSWNRGHCVAPSRRAVLLTNVPAVMARTALEFAQLRRPLSPARPLSVLLTLCLPSPAASPVVCRLAHPPLVLFPLLSIFVPSFLAMPLRDLGLNVVFAAVPVLLKLIVSIVTLSVHLCNSGGSGRAI